MDKFGKKYVRLYDVLISPKWYTREKLLLTSSFWCQNSTNCVKAVAAWALTLRRQRITSHNIDFSG